MHSQKLMAGRKGKRVAEKRRGKLRRWEASEYLWEVHGIKCAYATLAKYACAGTGPPFQYFNDWIPVYTPAGLDGWVESYFGNLSRPRTQTRKRSRKIGGSQSLTKPPTGQHDVREPAAAPSQTSVESAPVSA